MTTFKRNRSTIYTNGICNTFHNTTDRVLFFELDNPIKENEVNKIMNIYDKLNLNVMIHTTGNGVHFLSPTMIPLEVWKFAMDYLKDINKKCPMLTLRTRPNKYPNEEWIVTYIYNEHNPNNSSQMSDFLNNKFKTFFIPNLLLDYKIKTVSYPLPLSEFCK